MFQQLLVGLDGSEYSETALQYSLRVAKQCEATLHGVHVVDIVQVESPLMQDLAGAIGAAPLHNLTTLMRQNLELRGQQLLAQFRQVCDAERIPCQEHLVTGVVPTEISRLAADVDLVVLGRGGLHTRLSKALLGSAVDAVIRHSSTPTMVTPTQFAEIRNPVLATDGSLSAMAALETAIAFVQQLQLQLSVVHCTTTGFGGEEFLTAVQQQLTAAGIACKVEIYQGNAHEDLLQYISDHGHDLVFMGAFGQRRIVEWVVGSTTQYFLRTAPVPLVLCHERHHKG